MKRARGLHQDLAGSSSSDPDYVLAFKDFRWCWILGEASSPTGVGQKIVHLDLLNRVTD